MGRTKRTLFRIEGQPGSFIFTTKTLPEVQPREKASPVDMEIDSTGHLWVGYSRGLAWLDDQDQWHKIVTDQPVTLVRGFALSGDDIWVAHRRPRRFFASPPRRRSLERNALHRRRGYVPSGTELLKRDSRGWIWRGATRASMSPMANTSRPTIGFTSNVETASPQTKLGQYGFFQGSDGAVWITGDEGVTRLRPASFLVRCSARLAPRITRIEADGRLSLSGADSVIACPRPPKFCAWMSAVSTHLLPHLPLRYRFQPGPRLAAFPRWLLPVPQSVRRRLLARNQLHRQRTRPGYNLSPSRRNRPFRAALALAAALLAAVTAIILIIVFTPPASIASASAPKKRSS